MSGEVKLLLAGLLVVIGVLTVSLRLRSFTIVDQQGIAAGTWCYVRRLPWDGIHDIRTVTRPEPVVPRTVAYAYRSDGRRVLLSCMDDRELPVLDLEVAGLRSLLRERRPADWAPDPLAESRIARQTARAERSDRLFRWMSGWRAGVVVVVLTGIIGTLFLFAGS
ncbi:hypothetical protein [Streptomyces virginiae]|uniref:hypothetical protein n=1 Tax=Streptomyces virginiae TaxID=1961 RepID=UPI003431B70E